ncbi:MAG: hypothetical protein QY328_05560 [Anaerolineales bacterium]|nr:MAG: hypothetical protein QY328_05560 [Anaerolineales bacterium]
MSLIDRYVAEVGRHLPAGERADIEAEIRSTLEDTVEERGKPASDETVSEVLQQFGDPELLAQKYSQTKNYLIGTHWYVIYVESLKRVLITALPISFLAIFFVKFAEADKNFIGVTLQAAGQTLNIWVYIVFWMTVTFVILERLGIKPGEMEHLGVDPVESGVRKTRAWTPDQLPPLPKPRQISVGEAITDILMSLFGIGFVALSTSFLRVQGGDGNIPLLHPRLWDFWLPLFFIIAGLTLIHEMFKLKIGNWTPALTITNVILSLVSIGYLLALVFTQEVVNPKFLAALEGGGVTPEMQISTSWSVGITAAIIIGIYVWNIVNSIVMARRLPK